MDGQPLLQPRIITVDGHQHAHRCRQRQDHQPRALHELGGDDDAERHRGGRRAYRVDRQPVPVLAPLPPPVRHHAELAHGEGKERPDGEQGDQLVGDAAEQDQQPPAGGGEEQHADREDQPPIGGGEAAREIVVERYQPGEPGKADEAGVGRQAQHGEQARHRHVEQHPAPGDGGGELGQHAAIAGLGLVHGGEAVAVCHHGDAGQQQPQRDADHGQRPVRVGHHRIAERADAVRHGLHPGHRRAAGGEGPKQQPQAHRLGRAADRRRRHHRLRMAGRDIHQPPGDQAEEAGEKSVGRQREQQPGLAGAAQIGQRHQGEDAEAQLQRPRMQRRHRRGERADAGRDADRDVQHIVDHQRRGGEQSPALAEIVLGDGVGAAVGRIGDDGLPVGEIEDQQQQADRRDHPADPGEAHRAQRHEDGQRRLRSVGGGAEPVQPHRRHARDPADLLLAPLAIGEPAAEDEIAEGHCGSSTWRAGLGAELKKERG